jgi:hypothetical protein
MPYLLPTAYDTQSYRFSVYGGDDFVIPQFRSGIALLLLVLAGVVAWLLRRDIRRYQHAFANGHEAGLIRGRIEGRIEGRREVQRVV